MQYLRRKEVLIPLLLTIVVAFVFTNGGRIRALYYNERGVAYLRSRELDRARQLLTAAIQADPSYPVPYYNLGLVYRLSGDNKTAIGLFKRALDNHPDFYMARLDLARTLAQMGKFAKAKAELRKLAAIPAFKGDVNVILAQIRKGEKGG